MTRRPTLLGIAPPSIPSDTDARTRIAMLFALDELAALKAKWREAGESRVHRKEAAHDGE